MARLVEITRPTQMPAVKKAEEGAGAGGENKAKSRFSGEYRNFTALISV